MLNWIETILIENTIVSSAIYLYVYTVYYSDLFKFI